METPNTVIGLIAFISGVVLLPLAQKGVDFIMKKSDSEDANKLKEIEEERIISDSQMKKLANHHLFLQVDEIINNSKSVYYNSKKGRAQEIFTLMFYYILTMYKLSAKEQVKRVDKNRKAEKDHVTRLVKESIVNIDSVIINELINRNIPKDVIFSFLGWYKDHYDWYISQLNTVLNIKTGYYGQLDMALWTSSTFANALFAGFKQKINTFNGNIESKLTDEIYLNIDWGESFLNPAINE